MAIKSQHSDAKADVECQDRRHGEARIMACGKSDPATHHKDPPSAGPFPSLFTLARLRPTLRLIVMPHAAPQHLPLKLILRTHAQVTEDCVGRQVVQGRQHHSIGQGTADRKFKRPFGAAPTGAPPAPGGKPPSTAWTGSAGCSRVGLIGYPGAKTSGRTVWQAGDISSMRASHSSLSTNSTPALWQRLPVSHTVLTGSACPPPHPWVR